MTQTAASHDHYLAAFETLPREHPSASWLAGLRERAITRFREIGLPIARRGNEPWKYTAVTRLATGDWPYRYGAPKDPSPEELRALVPWNGAWSTAVFVNGRYSPALSSLGSLQGASVTSLAEAAGRDGAGLEEHLGRYATLGEDEFEGFLALNTAFLRDGAFIHLSRNSGHPSPLHIVYLSDGPGVSFPRTLVVAEPGSRAAIIETYAGPSGDAYLTDPVTEIILKEGAHVEHYRLLLDSRDANHIGTSRVRQDRDSTFSSLSFATGAALGRNDFKVTLDGPGGTCKLRGLYVTGGDQHIDNYLNIDHAQPHCSSRMYYKGILDGRSRAVFGGTVLVRKGADKTDAYQEDKNLLLSDEAEVDSKPSLEIYADDVKCGHGATAGALADEALFYMRSRGVDERTANVLLVKGFASEILDEVRIEPLRQYLEDLTLKGLPRFSEAEAAA